MAARISCRGCGLRWLLGVEPSIEMHPELLLAGAHHTPSPPPAHTATAGAAPQQPRLPRPGCLHGGPRAGLPLAQAAGQGRVCMSHERASCCVRAAASQRRASVDSGGRAAAACSPVAHCSGGRRWPLLMPIPLLLGQQHPWVRWPPCPMHTLSALLCSPLAHSGCCLPAPMPLRSPATLFSAPPPLFIPVPHWQTNNPSVSPTTINAV